MREPVIVIEKLSFRYPDGRSALQALDLCVDPGEKLALVGPNGAGKSTLLLHLNGVLREDAPQGRVRIAGVELNRRTLRAVRSLVGLVFQDPDDQLFSPTVAEDVAFGPLHLGCPPDAVHERVERALAQVGMVGFGPRMPHHLSLGERKRIAIATVLAMEPQILALDEPSAGLDLRARRGLVALLQTLPQTMLVATHDMRLAWELCPRTVVLDGGCLVADGPTRELLQDGDLMDRHGLETIWGAPELAADLYSRTYSNRAAAALIRSGMGTS